jgi:hypothetical protein
LATVGQAVAQPPQWLGSAARSAQTPLHGVNPLLHAKVQAPVVQVALASATLVVQATHAVPLPHAVGAVPGWQAPPEQQPEPHEFPHAPQLLGSVEKSAQPPSHEV